MDIKSTKARGIDLKMVFSDVLKGYTVMLNSLSKTKEELYIKHIGIFQNVETDRIYDECMAKAKEKNLPTEADQIEYLNKEDIWTREKENKLSSLQEYLSTLSTTKSKLFLKSQINDVKQQMDETEIEIEELKNEKYSLIGFTAEKYASKRANEIYMQQAVYRDKDFKELAITEEDFDYLSDDELTKFVGSYNDATEHIIMDNLKKISILPFFCNYFYLCDDNPFTFYGKPVVDLTFFQSELFAYGRYFKNLAQNSKAAPPEEIRNDPDKLIEFYEMRSNADEMMEKIEKKSGEKAGASSLVGATQEDLEAIGYKKGAGKTIDLMDVAAEKGGQLSMDDFIDLHG